MEIKELLEEQHKAILAMKATQESEIDRLEREIDELVKRGRPHGVDRESRAGSEEMKQLSDFLRAGEQGNFVTEAKAVTLADGADIAVPGYIDSYIENLALPFSPMRRVCRVTRDKTGNFSQLVNTRGLAVGHVGEKDARPETDAPGLAEVKPFMGELYANPAITQTALDDMVFDAGGWITTEIGEAFGVQENEDFTIGSGTKKAKGFLAYDATEESDGTRDFGKLQFLKTGVAGGFKATSATVSPADDLSDLVYSLKAGYRQGAVWMMNSKTLGIIRKWKDADGNNIWQRSMVAGQPETIMGYDVIENESMPNAGAAGAVPIAFGNFRRGYLICDRIGIRLVRDPYTNKPYVHFYTTKRVGGGLVNSEAIKLLKQSA